MTCERDRWLAPEPKERERDLVTMRSCEPDDGHCITCSDEGIVMHVVRACDEGATCTDEHGVAHEVAVDLVGPVLAGDELVVHAGVAIARLTTAEHRSAA